MDKVANIFEYNLIKNFDRVRIHLFCPDSKEDCIECRAYTTEKELDEWMSNHQKDKFLKFKGFDGHIFYIPASRIKYLEFL